MKQRPLKTEKEFIQPELAGSRTAHSQPVIGFPTVHGNTLTASDALEFNRDGLGGYGCAQPYDTQFLQEHSDFPFSVTFAVNVFPLTSWCAAFPLKHKP